MSTFLELVQELHRECGAAGSAPSTTAGQTGEANRLVNWIVKADHDIQTMWHNWEFLRDTSFSMNTAASTRDMAKPADINSWDNTTFKIDGNPIEVVEYEKVKREVFDLVDTDEPGRIIILHNDNLRFDPIPDDAYTITADYFKVPTKLADNSDVSAIPAQFHDNVIVGMAILYYANYEDAGDIKDQGNLLVDTFLPRLESLELPNEHNSRYNSSNFDFEVIAE